MYKTATATASTTPKNKNKNGRREGRGYFIAIFLGFLGIAAHQYVYAPNWVSPMALPPNDPRGFNFTLKNNKVHLNGKPVNIKGVNWYGFENANMVPEGLYANSMETYFKFLAANGFNAVRVPFSAEFAVHFDNTNTRVGTNPSVAKPSYFKNDPDLHNKTPREVMSKFLKLAFKYNMLVLPGLHQFYAGHWDGSKVINTNWDASNALWYYIPDPASGYASVLDVPDKRPAFSIERVCSLWVKMTMFFKDYPHVFAVDVKNEPRGMFGPEDTRAWPAWADAAGKIGTSILRANPRLILFVEGLPGNRINWGGNLLGVASRAVKVYDTSAKEIKGRVVYSPHVYGPDVAPGLEYTDAVWDHYFGNLRNQTIVVGEWGGFMNTKPGRGTGLQDLEANRRLAAYMRRKNLDAFYWALNPTSGDTGGLFLDDAWSVPAFAKLEVIKSAIPNPTRFDFASQTKIRATI